MEEKERRSEAAPATEVFSLLNKLNKSKEAGVLIRLLLGSSGNGQISFASLFVIFLTNQLV